MDFMYPPSNQPLAIAVDDFWGENATDANQLSWLISAQEEVDHFVVERSADGNTFFDIGKIDATLFNEYQFTDRNPMRLATLYRLRIVAKDGKPSWSHLISLAQDTDVEFEIFPNPSSGRETTVYLNLPAEQTARLDVFDQNGRNVHHQEWTSVAQGVQRLDLPTLALGMYVLRCQTGLQAYTKRLVVQ